MSLSRWIDVDLSTPPDGHGTGLIEQPPAELLASFSGIPWYDEIASDEMVPRDQWKAMAAERKAHFRATVAEIYSQGSTSACVGFGSAQACEVTLNRRYGRKHRVALSGMSVYDQIGDTIRSGAYIPDGMAFLQDAGPLPLDTPANRLLYGSNCFPDLEWKWQRPKAWKDTAKLFRVTKAAKAQGADMVASALLKGRCGIWGRDHHCVPPCYLDFAGNTPVAAYPNSWTKEWGDEGWGYDSESVFKNLVMYVILEVSTRPDLNLPVVA